MKQDILEKMKIPEGITCELHGSTLVCKKEGNELKRKLSLPEVEISVSGNELVFSSKKATKRHLKLINSHIAHIKNMFSGLSKEFSYTLEACNVHFPMTLKVEKDNLLINNFLGEKKPRIAKIHSNTSAEVKGQRIIVRSHDKEAAGITVSNIERATKIKNRDRRVFQDGIYLVERPGREA